MQVIRYHWPAILPEGFWSCIRSAHLFRNIHDPWGMVPVLNWITFQAVKPQSGDCHQFPPLELDGCTRFAPKASTSRSPKADRIPLGIGEPGEAAVVRNIHLRHHHLAAELLRLRQVGSDILHFDVENRVVVGLVPERADMPLDSALRSGLNHEGRAHLRPAPTEEGSIELDRKSTRP